MSLSERKVLFLFVLLSALIHAAGVFIFGIRPVKTPVFQNTDLIIIDDFFFTKSAPPKEKGILTTANSLIPTFISLPETALLLNEKSSFVSEKIKSYESNNSEEEFLKEAKKIVLKDVYYFDDELDSEKYLPLEETGNELYSFMFEESMKKENSELLPSLNISYNGFNRKEIRKKYSFLHNSLLNLNLKPDQELVIGVSFTEDNELVNCQIDKSSGNSDFDKEVLRILKGESLPSDSTKIKWRGQLKIKWG